MKKCPVCKTVAILAGIGALNWIFVVYLNTDIVARLLGNMTTAAKVVYTLVGISGALVILGTFGMCPCTKKECK